jgi:uncharacterized membrane protein YczE
MTQRSSARSHPDEVLLSAPVLPRLNAVAQLRAGRKARRIPQLFVGLAGYGAAVMMLVESGLGAASWNVLSEGVAQVLGNSFGSATNLIALSVMVFWIPMRELPGLGTLLNVLMVGAAADLTAVALPTPQHPAAQILMLCFGLVLLAFCDALYLGAQFGAGPRDGLMTGLVRLTGRPVWLIRTGIEVVVATAGWIMGGTLGFGTVLVALSMGPLVGLLLPPLSVDIRQPHVVSADQTSEDVHRQ